MHSSGYYLQTASPLKTDLLILTMIRNPPTRSQPKPRTLILCFDGTTDQYNDTVRAHFSHGYSELRYDIYIQ